MPASGPGFKMCYIKYNEFSLWDTAREKSMAALSWEDVTEVSDFAISLIILYDLNHNPFKQIDPKGPMSLKLQYQSTI